MVGGSLWMGDDVKIEYRETGRLVPSIFWNESYMKGIVRWCFFCLSVKSLIKFDSALVSTQLEGNFD